MRVLGTELGDSVFLNHSRVVRPHSWKLLGPSILYHFATGSSVPSNNRASYTCHSNPCCAGHCQQTRQSEQEISASQLGYTGSAIRSASGEGVLSPQPSRSLAPCSWFFFPFVLSLIAPTFSAKPFFSSPRSPSIIPFPWPLYYGHPAAHVPLHVYGQDAGGRQTDSRITMLRRLKSKLFERARELSHKDRDDDAEFAKYYSDFYVATLQRGANSTPTKPSLNESIHEFYVQAAHRDQPRSSTDHAPSPAGKLLLDDSTDDMTNFYGPINPDLLGGFGPPVAGVTFGGPLAGPIAGLISVPAPTSRQSMAATTESSAPKFTYRSTDPSILSDFSSFNNQTNPYSNQSISSSRTGWSTSTTASSPDSSRNWSPPAQSAQSISPNTTASSSHSNIPATGTPLRLLASLLSNPVSGSDSSASGTAREQPSTASSNQFLAGNGQAQKKPAELTEPGPQVLQAPSAHPAPRLPQISSPGPLFQAPALSSPLQPQSPVELPADPPQSRSTPSISQIDTLYAIQRIFRTRRANLTWAALAKNTWELKVPKVPR